MPKNASSSQAGKPQAPTVKNLPLFFERPVALDMKRHAKAGVLPMQDISFAATTNSIIVNAAEFFEAAKHYPIVFTQGDAPLPAVIVGLEQQNYFVGAKGQWKEGAYLPAYVRKYPFVFMDAPERNEFLLCVDEASAQYKVGGGKGTLQLFKDSVPSEVTRNALEFCTAYHNHHQHTRHFCKDIADAGLLIPMRSDTKLNNGREVRLGGFLSIDEKKLSALPDAKVLEFFKKGWLPFIYASLMSAANWTKLADMAASHETPLS